ncbi:MAG: hypothetical protein KDI30_01220, partial [Pseudomonadales bacterium]|nr:hypothetical protein [Pseudomonadales bacterium]
MPLLAINKNSGQARPISLDDCDATSQNDFIWFHSAENDIQEEDRFFSAMRLAIDPLALADARRRRHPPKFENFGNYLVLLIREIDKDDISEAFRPNHLSIIYGEHFIYTRCTLESAAISQCVNELQTGQVTFKSPDHLVCRIVRLISDSCNSILADIEDQIEDIEDRILVKGTEKDLNYLLSLGNNMKKLGRSLSYQTSAIEELFQLEKAHLLHIYQDIYENTERNASRANLYQSIIADLINGYISINSHHL